MFIVEDEALLLSVLEDVGAELGWTIAGGARDEGTALRVLAGIRPSVAVIDINLGLSTGFGVSAACHAAGLGGGIALAFVGPRLIGAEGPMLEEMWRFEQFFGRVGSAGLAVLIVTGPLMLWLKFGGPAGLTWWFGAKMLFVAIALIGVITHQWAGSRFHRGDREVIPLMFASGRVAGASMALAVLCAVFTFN